MVCTCTCVHVFIELIACVCALLPSLFRLTVSLCPPPHRGETCPDIALRDPRAAWDEIRAAKLLTAQVLTGRGARRGSDL